MIKKIPISLRYCLTPNIKFALSTICIVAGDADHDAQGAKIMQALKAKSSDKIDFIGIGGPQMAAEGLQSYCDVNGFVNRAPTPFKNFNKLMIETRYHFLTGYQHFKNIAMLKQLTDKTSFNEDLKSKAPDSFITVGNHFFMRKFYNYLVDYYNHHGVVRPPTFHYGKTHVNFGHEYLPFLDHMFYTTPKVNSNFEYFTFPSTCVGFEGVGRAYQSIYSNSSSAKALADANGVFLHPKMNQEISESLIKEQRTSWRQSMNIDEDNMVIYIHPGTSQEAEKFTSPLMNQTMKNFWRYDGVMQLKKSNFTILVQKEKGVHLSGISSECKVIEVGPDSKYAAMCAADFGVVYNGDQVAESAACQLPVVVIENMPFLTAYYEGIYNQYYVDINIAKMNEIYKELVSTSANPNLLAECMHNLYVDPKLKYWYADKYASTVYNLVPSVANEESLTHEGNTFTRHGFTNETIANKVLNASKQYDAIDQKTVGNVENARKSLLNSTGLAYYPE